MDDSYEGPSFTAADHTRVVRAFLEHPLHVFKYLYVPSGQTPSTLEFIDAALEVRSFDADTKALLRTARAAFVRFEAERAENPNGFNARFEMIHAALEGKSIAEMIAALDALLAQAGLDDDSVAGLELAKAILLDGADTIYSPDYPPNELLETATDTGAHEVAVVDAEAAAALGGGSVGGAAAGAASIGAAAHVIYAAFFK